MYSRHGLLVGVLCAGLSALPSFARADPGSSPAASTAATTVDGRLKVAIFAENRSAFPASTTLFCIARADLVRGRSRPYEYRYFYAKATVTPEQVSCTVEIPYRASVSDPADAEMWVMPSISASPLDPGTVVPLLGFMWVMPRTEFNVTLPYITFPLPRDGATTVKIVRSFI